MKTSQVYCKNDVIHTKYSLSIWHSLSALYQILLMPEFCSIDQRKIWQMDLICNFQFGLAFRDWTNGKC